MSDTQTLDKRAPDLHIHVKVQHDTQSRIGHKIGIGFLHKDQKGLNIILDAQPIPNISGQIELVAFPATS